MSGYRVADLVIDVGRQSVARGDTEIKLSPRSFALLLALVRAAPDVLSVEQLMERAWPGVVVGPETVSQRVRIIREALGDSARAPRYIAGVRGRGYRLAAPVVACAPRRPRGDASAAGVSRWPSRSAWIAGAAIVLLVAGAAGWWNVRTAGVPAGSAPEAAAVRASIAVLPFTDLSREHDQEYFSDGLAEELVNLLAQSPGLRVIARTSSFSFKSKDLDVATIARLLNVTHVLEGSVRKSGHQIRVTVQLVDASNSAQVWADTYEGGLDDIFAVQERVAASVANALQVRLDLERPRAATPAEAHAYERYLKARFFYYRRASGDVERAKKYYLRALELAPGDARAWAGLAAVYGLEFARGGPGRAQALAKQREAAQKALALDPELPEAHSRLGDYFENAGDSSAAKREHHRALALDPNDPLALSVAAGNAAQEGRLAEAIELQERAVALDPAAYVYQSNLGAYLAAAGRFEEARAALLEALELNPAPTATDAAGGIGLEATFAQVLLLLGQVDEAEAVVEHTPPGPDREQGLALIEHARGRHQSARAALRRLAADYDEIDAIRLAEVYAYWGEVDRAFDWLEAGQERIRSDAASSADYAHIRWGDYRISMLLSPLLRPLRGNPRWERLVENAA
ncbi:MAG TPA: winged helix-turn-helix domain-containing protein [Gammaproteobacteria bacterium]